jgi:hypothetical protein
MTKPTGRPRGRPKTKEYVTLMARVPQELADQVKRYASLHRQPISVVIRDGLILLMEEYPFAADRSVPHRLAAHEFLSDRYESPLDTLIGETDSAEREALLYDVKEDLVETVLSGTNGGDEYTSGTKEDIADMLADSNTESPITPVGKPARGRSRKASDTKAAPMEGLPEQQQPAIVSDTKFDPDRHVLGKLCPRGHEWGTSGQTLRRRANLGCLACDAERARERRQRKAKATPERS